MRLFDYIHQGGTIMYILLGLNILGFAIMISKFILFNKESKNTSLVIDALKGRVSGSTTNTEALIEMAKQELSLYVAGLEKGLITVKIIAAIAPLLGLLGTVLGVLVSFQVMSQQGLSNPGNFAGGISMALVTTVGGLIVAIPHFIGHNYLISTLDQIEISLEKELIHKVVS